MLLETVCSTLQVLFPVKTCIFLKSEDILDKKLHELLFFFVFFFHGCEY